MATETLSPEDLLDAWSVLSRDERVEGFRLLPRAEAEEFLMDLKARDQAEIILALPPNERRSWLRLLPPDDVADVIQEAPEEFREELLDLLDPATRKEVSALLAYAEDAAGGLMNPRYARLRPDMRVDEALAYLRLQASGRLESIYYTYVLDADQRLLGVVSFRELFAALATKTVREIMRTEVVAAREEMDQEALARLMAQHDYLAVPVVDAENRMKGIVTLDDIVDVVQEEATEDIHKIGGVQAIHAPYLEVGLGRMIRKRAGWLSVLFLGELLTASAMGFYEHEIARAVVLALFLPLIISSGGNSGSQASTLVIRAMALGEVRLRDWWRVCRREIASGLALGAILAVLGLARILIWEEVAGTYGEHAGLIGATVGLTLVGIVLWGTLAGSMLPFLLRRLGLDPASASAPFVATLVDVTGVLMYFGVGSVILRGTLL
jgi:magnesium transporter